MAASIPSARLATQAAPGLFERISQPCADPLCAAMALYNPDAHLGPEHSIHLHASGPINPTGLKLGDPEPLAQMLQAIAE